MATSYPGGFDSYTNKVDGVTDVLAADINNLQDAMVAVQARLGNTASGANITASGAQTIDGTKTFSSQINVGGGSAGEKQIYLHNSVRQTYFYVSTGGGVGLWDSTGAINRWISDTSGNFTASGNVTAYSDERLKTNWRPLAPDFLTRFSKVKTGVYDRTDNDITQVGVSAQSLREVLPQAVLEDGDGMLSVSYGNAALAACVALAKEVVSLREELNALKLRLGE